MLDGSGFPDTIPPLSTLRVSNGLGAHGAPAAEALRAEAPGTNPAFDHYR